MLSSALRKKKAAADLSGGRKRLGRLPCDSLEVRGRIESMTVGIRLGQARPCVVSATASRNSHPRRMDWSQVGCAEKVSNAARPIAASRSRSR